MKYFATLSLLSLAVLAVMSAKVGAAGFDCTKAAMPTDFVICSADKGRQQ